MIENRIFLVILLTLPGLVYSQENPITKQTHLQGCSFIVKSCKTMCETNPNDIVRWTIHPLKSQVSCTRANGEQLPKISTDASSPTSVMFDVKCCDDVSVPNAPAENTSTFSVQCLDEKRLNTLFILGVATLSCILLMCLFVCVGIFLIRRRNGLYRLEGSKEESQSLTKSSIKNKSPTLSYSDDNNSPSTSSSTPPPKYIAIKTSATNEVKVENDDPYEDTEQMTGIGERAKVDSQEYVNHESLMANGARSVMIKKDATEVVTSADVISGNSAVMTTKRTGIREDYEIRGGFIRPKRAASSMSEKKSARFAGSEETTKIEMNSFVSNLADEINLSLASSTQQAKAKSPEVEDPYVEAPPLKSVRSCTKDESPGAYQTLLTSNPSLISETNEYNTLLHNGKVTNTDVKALLFLNNNSREQNGCKSSKCDVTIKSATQTITASSDA